MRTLARLMLLGATITLLQACNLGGTATSASLAGGGAASAGGTGTFALGTFQSIAPDFIHSFNVSGADSNGAAVSGSFSAQNLASTTFNGQSAIPRTETLTLTNVQTGGFTTDQRTLYLGPGFQVLGSLDNLSNVRCLPIGTMATLPAFVTPGQNAALGNLSCSDGTQRQLAWRVDSAAGGLAVMVLVTTTQDGAGTQIATRQEGFVIDFTGAIRGFTLAITDSTTRVTTSVQSPII